MLFYEYIAFLHEWVIEVVGEIAHRQWWLASHVNLYHSISINLANGSWSSMQAWVIMRAFTVIICIFVALVIVPLPAMFQL